ncbi:hypothetical protein U1Q18_022883 [Sarracenia purpurea var. burkii]
MIFGLSVSIQRLRSSLNIQQRLSFSQHSNIIGEEERDVAKRRGRGYTRISVRSTTTTPPCHRPPSTTPLSTDNTTVFLPRRTSGTNPPSPSTPVQPRHHQRCDQISINIGPCSDEPYQCRPLPQTTITAGIILIFLFKTG